MSQYPKTNFFFWEVHPFFRLLLPLVLGIIAYFTVGSAIYLTLFSGIGGIAGYFYFLYHTKSWYNGTQAYYALISLFAVGYFVAYGYDARTNPRWYGHYLKPYKGYCLVVPQQSPQRDKEHQSIPVEVIALLDSHSVTATQGTAIMAIDTGYALANFQKHDTLLCPNNMVAMADNGNPGEVSYAQIYQRNNWYHRLYIHSPITIWGHSTVPPSFIDLSRRYLWSTIDKYVPATQANSLIKAMLLGDVSGLDKDLRSTFTHTGIAHILALSGGNISLLFIGIAYIMLWIKHKKWEWIKYLVAVPVVWFYIVLTGTSPSATRAAAMFSLITVAVLFNKRLAPLNQLFAVAFIMLCFQPNWLFSIGFQFSFTAVLSLFLFYEHIYHRISTKNVVLSKVWQIMAASLASNVLLAPLIIYYFHTFPAIFLVANVVGIILLEVVMLLGVGVMVLASLPAVAGFLGWLLQQIVFFAITWLHALEGYQIAAWNALNWSPAFIVVLYIAIAAGAYYLIHGIRPAFLATFMAINVLVLVCFIEKASNVTQRRLIVYNTPIGNSIAYINGDSYALKSGYQGDSAIIATGNGHYGCYKPAKDSLEHIYCIAGQRILIYNYTELPLKPFPTDVLVLNNHCQLNVHQIKQIFSPQMVVMGNLFDPHQRQKWKDSIVQYGIALHDVTISGAYNIKEQ
ncbi:MAG: ComEC/Rec2 family competence protein [Chitinophagia bacterium]|nr:ComEC/Rec2 family competence protein [Chitinophagia bacterium]